MSPKHHSVSYVPLPPPNPDVIVLPLYHQIHHHHHHPLHHRYFRQCLFFTAFIIFFAGSIFFLYPSDPTIHLARIHLNHVSVKSSPKLTLDVSFAVTIKVYNRDFFSLDYDSLLVSVGYRGRELGFVRSNGGRVGARRTSYVDATLNLDGLEVIHDVIYLIADLAKGVIPFDTETQVKGDLGLLFFKIPIQAKVSCAVYVNTNNQTVVRQDCYPE